MLEKCVITMATMAAITSAAYVISLRTHTFFRTVDSRENVCLLMSRQAQVSSVNELQCNLGSKIYLSLRKRLKQEHTFDLGKDNVKKLIAA